MPNRITKQRKNASKQSQARILNTVMGVSGVNELAKLDRQALIRAENALQGLNSNNVQTTCSKDLDKQKAAAYGYAHQYSGVSEEKPNNNLDEGQGPDGQTPEPNGSINELYEAEQGRDNNEQMEQGQENEHKNIDELKNQPQNGMIFSFEKEKQKLAEQQYSPTPGPSSAPTPNPS